MKKTLLVFLISTISFLCSEAQVAFQRTYGGPSQDFGYSALQTSDGGYIMAGQIQGIGAGGFDAYLVRTDANGDTLWTKTFGGAGDDEAHCIRQTSDGGFILAGYTPGLASSGDNYLLKTDANGNTIFAKSYGGTGSERATSVQQTFDGGYIIAGITSSFGAGALDCYLVKTDAAGNLTWSMTYGGSAIEWAYSVQQTSDSGYVIVGYTQSFGAGNEDIFLVKTDSVGTVLFSKTYGGASAEYGNCIIQTADGGFAIAGQMASFGAGGFDCFLLKTDATGNELWTKTYGRIDNDIAFDLKQTSDGGYILAGQTSVSFVGDAYIIKTSSTGNLLWLKAIGSSGNEEAHSIQQTSDGGYIIGGRYNSVDLYLIKLTSAGYTSCNSTVPNTITNSASVFSSNHAVAGVSAATVENTASALTSGGGTVTPVCFYQCALSAGISSSTNILCNGGNDGMATVSASGGTGTYTYSWSPAGGTGTSAGNLTAGNYTVTVNDSLGCLAIANVLITEPATLSANAQVINNVLCNGGSTGTSAVNANGGTGIYSYAWNPTGCAAATCTGNAAGCYTVTVTDANGCTASSMVCITEPSAITVSLTVTDASCSSCNNGSIMATAGGGTPTYTYFWTPAVTNTYSATNLSPGIYTCCIQDANGCTSCSSDTVSFPNSVNEISYPGPVIHPNPFSNYLIITTHPKLQTTITLFDYTGKQLLHQTTSSSETTLNTEGIAAGFYLLRVEDERGVRNYKVVKEN